jgi:DNA uptake protein ComE-like DNA-binding protein
MEIFVLLLIIGFCALVLVGITILIIYKIVTSARTITPKPSTPNQSRTPPKPLPHGISPSPLAGDPGLFHSTDRLTEICARLVCTDYYVAELIPKEKRANALLKYPPPDGGNIIALIDTTVFGSAKTGMAISESGISWHNWTMKTEKSSLRWSELATISIREFDRYNISLGEGNVFCLAGGKVTKAQLINLLETIKKEQNPADHQDTAASASSGDEKDDDILDANTASFDMLLTLPGVGVAEARMMLERRTVQPFSSMEELAGFLNMRPHKVEQLRSKLLFSKENTAMDHNLQFSQTETPVAHPAPSEAPSLRGRMID